MPRKNSVFGGIMTLGVAFGVGHGHDAAAMLLPKAVAVGSAASIAASIRDCESISWSQHSQLAQPGRVSRSWFSLLRAAGQMRSQIRGGEEGRDPSSFTLRWPVKKPYALFNHATRHVGRGPHRCGRCAPRVAQITED